MDGTTAFVLAKTLAAAEAKEIAKTKMGLEDGKIVQNETDVSEETAEAVEPYIDHVTEEEFETEIDALNDRCDNIENMGRFLSLWDGENGLPLSFPFSVPYSYKTGDYYRVGAVVTNTPKYAHHISFNDKDHSYFHYDFDFISSDDEELTNLGKLITALKSEELVGTIVGTVTNTNTNKKQFIAAGFSKNTTYSLSGGQTVTAEEIGFIGFTYNSSYDVWTTADLFEATLKMHDASYALTDNVTDAETRVILNENSSLTIAGLEGYPLPVLNSMTSIGDSDLISTSGYAKGAVLAMLIGHLFRTGNTNKTHNSLRYVYPNGKWIEFSYKTEAYYQFQPGLTVTTDSGFSGTFYKDIKLSGNASFEEKSVLLPNYKPSGSSYDGTRSTVEENMPIDKSSIYFYDGTQWILQASGGGGGIVDVEVDGQSKKSGNKVSFTSKTLTFIKDNGTTEELKFVLG